jgi:two-component system chemotaxis response regulator CheB
MNEGFELVVLAGSVGGFAAISRVLADLPDTFPAAVAVVLHRTARPPLLLPDLLRKKTRLQVADAADGLSIVAGTAYIAPPDGHLYIETDRTFSLIRRAASGSWDPRPIRCSSLRPRCSART